MYIRYLEVLRLKVTLYHFVRRIEVGENLTKLRLKTVGEEQVVIFKLTELYNMLDEKLNNLLFSVVRCISYFGRRVVQHVRNEI